MGELNSACCWVPFSQQKGGSFLLRFASPCWFLSWQNCWIQFYLNSVTLWLERPDLSRLISQAPDSSLSSLSVFSYSIFRFIRFSMSMKLSLHELQHISFRTCDQVLSSFRKWLAQVDSNHRPRAYQARALTCWAMRQYKIGCSVPENWTTN